MGEAAPLRGAARLRDGARWTLAALLVAAGLSHLFWARRGFRVAVPSWAPAVTGLDPDAIVVASGAVELLLGGALVALPRSRGVVASVVAGFFVAVFPGNVSHWRRGRSDAGSPGDRARFVRLFLQPVLVAWALWVRR